MKINSIQTNYAAPSFGQVLTQEPVNCQGILYKGKLTNNGELYDYSLSFDKQKDKPDKYCINVLQDSDTVGFASYHCDENGAPKAKPFELFLFDGYQNEFAKDCAEIIDMCRNKGEKPSGSSFDVKG